MLLRPSHFWEAIAITRAMTVLCRDSVILTFVCEGTSIYGGFAIFSVLGYMAYESGVPIDKVVSSGDTNIPICTPTYRHTRWCLQVIHIY